MHRGRPITLSDDALLDTARDVFLERGLEATTSYIAKRARISESVIFYRYKTKEALFSAVFEREMVMPAAFAKLGWVATKGEIADNLFDAGMSLVETAQRLLPLLTMALASPTKLPVLTKHARTPHPLKLQMLGVCTRYFEAEIAAGRLRPTSPEVLARVFIGGVGQFVMSAQFQQQPAELDAPAFLRGMIDVLLRGAQPAGDAPPARGRARAARGRDRRR